MFFNGCQTGRLMIESADLYKNNREQYNQIAQEWTQIYVILTLLSYIFLYKIYNERCRYCFLF